MGALGQKIRKSMVEAIAEYDMLQDGDRVLVAVSGGKDSSVMLEQLLAIQARAPFSFSLHPVIVDQKQPGFSVDAFRSWVGSLGLELSIIEEDTYSIVLDKTPAGKTYCSLCSRLRRGILYNYAHTHSLTKIALGHHRDDLNETILMNMFYAGQLASMPPRLLSDDGRNTVIRPLCFVPERWIIGYAQELQVPVIPCNLCGSQEGMKRQRIKKLLSDLECEQADIGSSMIRSLQNVRPSQLADKNLFQFCNHSAKI
jgi:tRNA 2-thiocytidine biosynthesis protein TtcA